MDNKIVILDSYSVFNEEIFKRLSGVGVTHVYGYLGCCSPELHNGKNDYSFSDKYVEMAMKCNIKLIISYSLINGTTYKTAPDIWKYKTRMNIANFAGNTWNKDYIDCYKKAIIAFCERYKHQNINVLPVFGDTEYFYPQFDANDISGHLWCFDKYAIAEFQQYVKNKYTLDEYNFYTDSSYTNWEQVNPTDLNGELQLDNYGNVQNSLGLDTINAVNGNIYSERLSGNIRGFAITNEWYSKRIYDCHMDMIDLIAPYNKDNTIWMMASYLDLFRRHPYTRISSGMYDLLNIICKIKDNLQSRNINYNIIFPLIYKEPYPAYDDLFFCCLAEYYGLNVWAGSQSPYNIEYNLHRSLKYGFKGVLSGLVTDKEEREINYQFRCIEMAQKYINGLGK